VDNNIEEKTESVNSEDKISEELGKEFLKRSAIELLRDQFPDIDNIVDSAKEKYGEVYLYIFSETEFYIYRPITRKEYVSAAATCSTEFELEEAVCSTCVVYASVPIVDNSKAGTFTVLFNLIQYASNFGSNNTVVKL